MKYKLLEDDTLKVGGTTLFRVQATKDFLTIESGDLGGYIQSEDNLAQQGTCWLDSSSYILGGAHLSGKARLINSSMNKSVAVTGDALIENSYLTDNVYVLNAIVSNSDIKGCALLKTGMVVTKPPIHMRLEKFDCTFADNAVRIGCAVVMYKDIDAIYSGDYSTLARTENYVPQWIERWKDVIVLTHKIIQQDIEYVDDYTD